MIRAASYLAALLVITVGLPLLASANGGDQRLVEGGAYYINLSRAPFTPRVGAPTSFVASFFDVGAQRLVSDDLTVRVRITKLGDAPKGDFIFDQDGLTVKGGILEFPFTFKEAALHEVFFDFTFASNPEKVYSAPDFLIDVQPALSAEKSLAPRSTNLALGVGMIIAFLTGLFIGRKTKRA